MKCFLCKNELTTKCKDCIEYTLEEYEEYEECTIVRGQCGHEAHFHCVASWLRTHDKCPIDKQIWDFASYSSINE